MSELDHSGIKGMKWGIRRFQNEDGSLTPAGKERYNKQQEKENKKQARKKEIQKAVGEYAKAAGKSGRERNKYKEAQSENENAFDRVVYNPKSKGNLRKAMKDLDKSLIGKGSKEADDYWKSFDKLQSQGEKYYGARREMRQKYKETGKNFISRAYNVHKYGIVPEVKKTVADVKKERAKG